MYQYLQKQTFAAEPQHCYESNHHLHSASSGHVVMHLPVPTNHSRFNNPLAFSAELHLFATGVLRFRVAELRLHVVKLRFRMAELRLHVAELRFRMAELRLHVVKLRFRVAALRFRMAESRFRVAALRFRVAELRFRVAESRFRVADYPQCSSHS